MIEKVELYSPVFMSEIRRFIRSCYLHGYKDAWIENLKNNASIPTLQGMTGIDRKELNDIIRDELLQLAEMINREREIAETQTERNQGICPLGGSND